MSSIIFDKIKIGVSFVLILFIITACKKNEIVKAELKKEDFVNLSYAQHPLNTMDVYLPEKRTDSTGVIILLHGGAWSAGDKEELGILSRYYRDKGFATVNLNFRQTKTTENYRLENLVAEDIPSAVKFVAENARAWGISAEKMGMIGISSGAHLALLYTYAFNFENKVKAVVSVAGPANFVDIRNIGLEQAEAVEWLLGTSFIGNSSAYANASPIAHVNSLSKPTLVFHGSSDVFVPVQQSKDLVFKLEQANVESKLIMFEAGHQLLINPAHTERFLLESENWFREYVK